MSDQTDYRELLGKYLRFQLKTRGVIPVPARAREEYFSMEEWDRIQAVAEEVQQRASADR